MAEIKWIKITTDIFDDDKIKIIDRLPARDELLVIWFKLLALAGKVNQSGLLFLSNKIPYTTDMLAAVFNRDENTVKLALSVFEKYGMINIENNEVIAISNWEKHQNIDGMEKIREQTNKRVRQHRQRQKLLLECNVTDNVALTQSNAIDKDKDKELDKEKDKEKHKAKTPGCYSENENLNQAINDFIEFRASIKKPMKTERAIKMLINRLNKLTTDTEQQILIIEQSIFKGWTDVYELKETGGGKNGSSVNNKPKDTRELEEWEIQQIEQAKQRAADGKLDVGHIDF